MTLKKCALVIVLFISCSYVSLLPVPAVKDNVEMKCNVIHIDDLLKNNCTYIGFNPHRRDENQTKGECELKKTLEYIKIISLCLDGDYQLNRICGNLEFCFICDSDRCISNNKDSNNMTSIVTTTNTSTSTSMEVITEPTVMDIQVKEAVYIYIFLSFSIIISSILISIVTWKCVNIQSNVE